MSFPKDFLWGAASASAQIEGAYLEDGKCLSIWDVAGKHIKNGDTCHDACDHYHRYKEDVALMKELGLKSYRFSVSMCRVMPEEGRINPKGLEFYIKLVSELRKANIEPLCTLYHWDLPLWAQAKGGWKNDRIVKRSHTGYYFHLQIRESALQTAERRFFIVEKSADMRYNKMLNFWGVTGITF